MEAPVARIKPNTFKAFATGLFFIIGGVLLLVSFIIYLNAAVGLSVFIIAFEALGMTVNPQAIVAWLIGLIVFFSVLITIMTYVSVANISLTLYPDKLEYATNFFIIQLKAKVIPFSSVAKVYASKGSLINSGKVVIDLSGSDEHSMTMDYIDNAPEVAAQIQALIQKHKANYYAQYAQDYRYQGIVDRY